MDGWKGEEVEELWGSTGVLLNVPPCQEEGGDGYGLEREWALEPSSHDRPLRKGEE